MKDAIAKVREFHEKFGVPVVDNPAIPVRSRIALRELLIDEESAELGWALFYRDIVSIADGLADLIYVCIGAALEFGIPLDAVFDEVHRTNMLKVGGATRADGKILKPDGWQAPDIAGILERAK